MIFLVRNRTNTVHMLIKSTVDISGFSAILSSCGVCVAKTNLLDRVEFKFTPEQVALVGEMVLMGLWLFTIVMAINIKNTHYCLN